MSIGTWVGSPRSYTRGRLRAVQLIAVHHTAGSEGPSSAENGAAYDKTRTDGTSTNTFADSNSVAVEVADEDRAHHARAKGNEIALGLELCGTLQTRAQWLDPISDATLRNGALWAAEKVIKFGIPIRRLSVAEVRAAYYAGPGARPKGFAGHVDITQAFPEDGGDHTDPGPAFPWDVFLGYVAAAVAALQGPPAPPTVEDEDAMYPYVVKCEDGEFHGELFALTPPFRKQVIVGTGYKKLAAAAGKPWKGKNGDEPTDVEIWTEAEIDSVCPFAVVDDYDDAPANVFDHHHILPALAERTTGPAIVD